MPGEDLLEVLAKTVQKAGQAIADAKIDEKVMNFIQETVDATTAEASYKDFFMNDLEGIRTIKIETTSLPIVLVVDDVSTLTVQLYANDRFTKLESNIKQRSIEIKTKEPPLITYLAGKNSHLKVFIPSGYQERLQLESNRASIKMDGHQMPFAGKLSIEQATGSVLIDNALIGKLNIDLDHGDVHLNGVAFHDAKIRVDDGNINCDLIPNHFPKQIRLKGRSYLNNRYTNGAKIKRTLGDTSDKSRLMTIDFGVENGVISLNGVEDE